MNASKVGRWMLVLPITALFIALSWGVSLADGKGIFASKNCGSCHQIQGPAAEKTFDDQLKKKGPELWYSGSKFKKEWLDEWLEKPATIRPLKYNSVTDKNHDKEFIFNCGFFNRYDSLYRKGDSICCKR